MVDCAVLGQAVLDPSDPAMTWAIETISVSDCVVIGSPTYRGSYTGILKCLLDELPRSALENAMVLPLAVYQADHHRDVVLGSLHTTLGELGAALVLPALAIRQDDVDDATAAYVAQLSRRLTTSPSGSLALRLSKERHNND